MRPSPGRIWGRRLLALAAVAVVIVAAFLFWLRNSSLFEVTEVEVTGVRTSAAQIRAALEQEARDMTTLHVREQELAQAVSGYPTVASIEVDAQPLHKLVIKVSERVPVASVSDGDEVVPVSGDGYLLRGVQTNRPLPAIEPSARPGRTRLAEPDLEQARLLAAAPAELVEGIEGSRTDSAAGGVVVDLEDGIELRLGDAEDAERKWAAAAAVLSDPGLGTPAYVDVSVPERPVSGG